MSNKNNPWKYVHVDPNRIKNNPFLNPKAPPPPPPPPPPGGSEAITGEYILMPKTSTYAKGVHALREACKHDTNSAQTHPQFTRDDGSSLYRPLTFKETIEARVNDYESNQGSDDRLRFFNRWIDSCTAVAYKGGTNKFKIVPLCQELIEIVSGFNSSTMPINYDNITGVELDRTSAKYHELLSKDEVLNHPAWRAALQGDINLLKTYRDIVFAEKGSQTAMSFRVTENPSSDYMRALFVYIIDSNSDAYGNYNLNINGSFLRVCSEGTSKNP